MIRIWEAEDVDLYRWQTECGTCRRSFWSDALEDIGVWVISHAQYTCPAKRPIPEHFVRTTEGEHWRGKIRCAYCRSSGWPIDVDDPLEGHWSLNHGRRCPKREAVSA